MSEEAMGPLGNKEFVAGPLEEGPLEEEKVVKEKARWKGWTPAGVLDSERLGGFVPPDLPINLMSWADANGEAHVVDIGMETVCDVCAYQHAGGPPIPNKKNEEGRRRRYRHSGRCLAYWHSFYRQKQRRKKTKGARVARAITRKAEKLAASIAKGKEEGRTVPEGDRHWECDSDILRYYAAAVAEEEGEGKEE